jgi:hypothetical protein
VTVILIVIMGVMPAIGIALATRVWWRRRAGVHVVAEIAGHVREKLPATLGSEYTSRDLPIVEFLDESGKRRRITLREEVVDTEKRVTVVFPRGKPQEARIDRRAYLYVGPALLVAPGLALAVIYVALSIYATLAS